MNVLAVRDLSFSYRSRPVLKGVSFDAAPHQITAVLGPNGSGKTTLLRCIDGILPVGRNRVVVGERDLASLSRSRIARRIGYVAQRSEASRLSVFDAVLLGRLPHLGFSVSRRDLLAVNAIIEKLDLQELSLRRTDQLSGGELQKVSIARALVQEPDLLLLDEPTSSLDLKNQLEILSLIRAIVDGHNVAAVMSLHDVNTAVHYADRILFLKDGRITAACTKKDIDADLIERVYGVKVTVIKTEEYPVVIPACY